MSGNFIFGKWLIGSCQHISIQQCVRLLNSWCQYNICSRKSFASIEPEFNSHPYLIPFPGPSVAAVLLLDNGEPQKPFDLIMQSSKSIRKEFLLTEAIITSAKQPRELSSVLHADADELIAILSNVGLYPEIAQAVGIVDQAGTSKQAFCGGKECRGKKRKNCGDDRREETDDDGSEDGETDDDPHKKEAKPSNDSSLGILVANVLGHHRDMDFAGIKREILRGLSVWIHPLDIRLVDVERLPLDDQSRIKVGIWRHFPVEPVSPQSILEAYLARDGELHGILEDISVYVGQIDTIQSELVLRPSK